MYEHIQRFLDDVEVSQAEGTFQTRQSDLRNFNSHLEEQNLAPTDVTSYDIHKYLREQEKEGYSDWTVQSRYQSVKSLYAFLAGTMDVMEESPFEGDESLKRADYGGRDSVKHEHEDIVYVEPEEKDRLVEHVPDPRLRNELLVRLLWQTGLRRSEAAIIQIEQIDREERSIRILSPKTDSWRTVYYQPSLDPLMRAWMDGGYRASFSTAEASEYLFPTHKAEHIHPYQINEIVKEAAKEAGLQEKLYEDAMGRQRVRITAHALRHGHAVESLKSGIDVRTVQEHLGHSDIETTMQYLQIIEEDVKQAYRHFGTRSEA